MKKDRISILEPSLVGNERSYVNKCFDDNWISSQGKFVSQFEELVVREGIGHALATSNGTVALHLALVALGIGDGDEVIVPNITFGATLNAVMYTGAKPVLVDVNPLDWNICRESLNSAYSAATKAVLPVALFGNPSGMNHVAEWATQNDVYCIIDAAEAVGSTIEGQDIGTYGDAVIYSYFGNKTITTGEGGAVVFKDHMFFEHARVLRDHGMTPGRRYHHEYLGYNYRLTNLQAAVGVAQYERLNEVLLKRQAILTHYKERLSNGDVQFQYVDESSTTSCWVVAIRTAEAVRNKIETALTQDNIEYRRCFEPMNIQPAFKESKCVGTFEKSNKLYNEVLLLPTHLNLQLEDVERVIYAVLKGLK